jgi:hypothetical protein
MHGDELVGYVLLLRLADTLLNGYGTDSEITRLVDSLSIWINPLANPDGSFSADQDLSLRQSVRVNADSIDLNRDFPDPAAGEADDTTGHARENQAMMLFMKEHGFTLSANIHSGEEVVNYPWDYTYELHPDDDWYRFISREYADEARAVDPDYMALFTDGITNGARWYVIRGGRQDYVNYYLGGREITLELSRSFRLGSEYLEKYWNINRRSLLNYMAQCTYGIRGTVSAADNGEPVRAKIQIPGHDDEQSVIHSFEDHGDFYRLIKEGNYDLVFSSPGYLNDTVRNVEVTDHQATILHVELERGTTGAQQDKPQQRFHIYPNPAGDHLYIESNQKGPGPVELQIIGADGQLYYQQSHYINGHPILLHTESLPRGVLILRMISGEWIHSISFIKQ